MHFCIFFPHIPSEGDPVALFDFRQLELPSILDTQIFSPGDANFAFRLRLSCAKAAPVLMQVRAGLLKDMFP